MSLCHLQAAPAQSLLFRLPLALGRAGLCQVSPVPALSPALGHPPRVPGQTNPSQLSPVSAFHIGHLPPALGRASLCQRPAALAQTNVGRLPSALDHLAATLDRSSCYLSPASA